MTREEAIRCLSVHSSTNGSGLCTDEQHYEAKQMAIKALEQEPCEDTVSRKEIIEHYTTGEMANVHHIDKNHLLAFVEQLPPVRPQEQTGHWIRQDNTKEPLYGWYFCSECNSVIGDKTEFCSNCGAKMESEDKE